MSNQKTKINIMPEINKNVNFIPNDEMFKTIEEYQQHNCSLLNERVGLVEELIQETIDNLPNTSEIADWSNPTEVSEFLDEYDKQKKRLANLLWIKFELNTFRPDANK